MKKWIALILAALLLLSLCACGSKNEIETADDGTMPTVLNTAEYVLYQNIFYNQTGDDYIGKSFTKEGTFTILHDSYNDCTRYYVWGYNDETKCCDWQWEFVPTSTDNLPAQGCQVEVKGTWEKNEKALDGYWMVNAEISVKKAYAPAQADMLLTTMSDTLERVQLINMQQFADQYEGKTVQCYGRIASDSAIEDPYYDGSWQQPVSASESLGAIGTLVIADGVFKGGVVSDCTLTPTSSY